MKKSLTQNERVIVKKSVDVNDICRSLFDATKLNGFGYINFNTNGDFFYLANDCKWVEHFLMEQFHNDLNPNEIPEIFTNKYLIADNVDEQRISPAAMDFGYYHIFSIIEQNDSVFEIFSYTSESADPAVNNWYINNISFLEKHNCYFKQQATDLIKNTKKHSIIKKMMLTDELERIKKIADKANDEHASVIDVNQLQLGDEFNNAIISKQEIECIHYLLLGKTSKEIAPLIFKSPRTVEYYLNQLKRKFKASNKSDLISKVLSSEIAKVF